MTRDSDTIAREIAGTACMFVDSSDPRASQRDRADLADKVLRDLRPLVAEYRKANQRERGTVER